MWQVVYMVKTEEEAQQVRKALEEEYITPNIIRSGRTFQIMVTESELEDASEIIRDFIAQNG